MFLERGRKKKSVYISDNDNNRVYITSEYTRESRVRRIRLENRLRPDMPH